MRKVAVFLVAFLMVAEISIVFGQQPVLPTFDDKIVQLFADRPDDSVSYGAGFIVTPAGSFLTAAHIIRNIKTGVLYTNFRARVNIADSLRMVRVSLVHSFVNDTPSYDLALFQVDESVRNLGDFPYFVIGHRTKKGTPVIIAGFPKVRGIVPKSPVYRSGIVATNIVLNGAPIAILDLPPLAGFSGGAVVDISRTEARVFAVVRGYASGKNADLTDAYIIPIEVVKARLKSFNEEKWKRKLAPPNED